MYSDAGDTTSLVPGFPIRTSSDQRSVGSSPRLIAASNVLHRLPVPRHPPCALTHLQHEFHYKPIWKNCTSNTNTSIHMPLLAFRCSQPLSTNQTPHPTTKTRGDNSSSGSTDPEQQGLLSQSPIVCSANSPVPASPPHPFVVHQTRSTTDNGFLTALSLPDGEMLSWCSLERR